MAQSVGLRPLVPLLLVLLPAAARAEPNPLERLPDGAGAYVVVRPQAAIELARKLGLAELHALAGLRRQGIDPFAPGAFAPTGIDAAAPLAASLWQLDAKARLVHHRLVATVDPERLLLFLGGMASGGSSRLAIPDPASAEGRAGIRATLALPSGGVAILRLDGNQAIVDAVEPAGAKAPAAAAVATRWPFAPEKSLAQAPSGARRLITPAATLVLYVDGRAAAPLMSALARGGGKPRDPELRRAFGAAVQRADACAHDYGAAPSAFDDAAIAVERGDKGLAIRLGFGGANGLGLERADDQALAGDKLAVGSLASFQLFTRSLAPLGALARSGALAGSPAAIDAAADRCGPLAWVALLVRHPPQLLAAWLESTPLGSLLLTSGRNASGFLRAVEDQHGRWAFVATVERMERGALDALQSGAAGDDLSIGPTRLTVRPVGSGSTLVAIETSPAAHPRAFAADATATLRWALAQPPAAHEGASLGAVRIDAARIGALLETPGDPEPLLGGVPARLGVVVGALTLDRGLLELALAARLP